jgi:hypothetical protein
VRVAAWPPQAEAIAFVGTSFAVNVTTEALVVATKHQAPVFNFNVVREDCFAASGLPSGGGTSGGGAGAGGAHAVGAAHVIGKCEVTLQQLLARVRDETARRQKQAQGVAQGAAQGAAAAAAAAAGGGSSGGGGSNGGAALFCTSVGATRYPGVVHSLGFAARAPAQGAWEGQQRRQQPPPPPAPPAAKKAKREQGQQQGQGTGGLSASASGLSQLWASCDACGKWRRLPLGTDEGAMPAKWFCSMNPERAAADCGVPEEEGA